MARRAKWLLASLLVLTSGALVLHVCQSVVLDDFSLCPGCVTAATALVVQLVLSALVLPVFPHAPLVLATHIARPGLGFSLLVRPPPAL